MILVFWMLSFKPAFSLSSFILIKRLFSLLSFLPLGWCHLHLWGYWYFSLQSWFQLELHPAWHFSWCTLHISQISRVTIYSLDVLLSQFGSSLFPCSVLIVASWPACRFLRRQVRWSGIPISFRIFQFVVIHTVKAFSIVNEAEVDVFWNSLAFSKIQRMLAICSLVPLPFLNPAWTRESSQVLYCWSLVWRILSITLLACEMSTIVR